VILPLPRGTTRIASGYPWEHLQGVLMAARILERAGLSIWGVADQAIHRAAYGTSWSGSQNVWGAGKNVGFA
jgi:hypothetical protein